MPAPIDHPTAPPRRRRGAVGYLGIAMLLAGLAVLGYLGWQYFGSNIVSKHRADAIRHQTVKAWDRGHEGEALGLVRIPRFGSHYVEPIVRGFGADALAKGVGWYPQGAKVGEVGNYVLAGHRVTHGQPFRKFPELRKGDTVVIETRTATYTYRLRNSGQAITVNFTVGWPLWPVPAPDASDRKPTERLITLVTCSEIFHTDNRSVVIGKLVKKVPRSGS